MTSPLELLDNKQDRIPSFFSDKWNPMVFATLGFSSICFINFVSRKPVFSGIQNHIGFTLIGGGLGAYFDKRRNDYLAERDAVLRHYIQLHPDDFPAPKRVKFAEILDIWVPIR